MLKVISVFRVSATLVLLVPECTVSRLCKYILYIVQYKYNLQHWTTPSLGPRPKTNPSVDHFHLYWKRYMHRMRSGDETRPPQPLSLCIHLLIHHHSGCILFSFIFYLHSNCCLPCYDRPPHKHYVGCCDRLASLK